MAEDKAKNELVKIKMLRGVTGSDFEGRPITFSSGQEVEVEPRLAADLCNGHAVLVLPVKETAAAKHPNKENR